MVALKPCPFCGGTASFDHIYREDGDRYPRDFWHVRVQCENDCAHTSWARYGDQEVYAQKESEKTAAEQSAAEDWNTRYTAPVDRSIVDYISSTLWATPISDTCGIYCIQSSAPKYDSPESTPVAYVQAKLYDQLDSECSELAAQLTGALQQIEDQIERFNNTVDKMEADNKYVADTLHSARYNEREAEKERDKARASAIEAYKAAVAANIRADDAEAKLAEWMSASLKNNMDKTND